MDNEIPEGLGLTCPYCGTTRDIRVDLNRLKSATCGTCGEMFLIELAAERAAQVAARWAEALKWLASAPAPSPESE